MAKRSSKQRLIGWGVFAAMIVVIVAIFFVTRMLGGVPHAPAAAATPEVAEADTSFTTAPDAPSAALPSDDPGSAASTAPPSASAASATSAAPVQASATPSASAAADTAATEPAVEVVDAGSMTQQSRRGFLLTLIQQGVFTGVQALDTPPKVGVTALFKGLSVNLQQQFIAVVYAYINNGAAGTQTLELIDASTGSQVGSYSASDGLKLG